MISQTPHAQKNILRRKFFLLRKTLKVWNRTRTRLPFREASSALRMLPDFIIIGGQRCGSTSLYRSLTSHPGILSARIKEVHFFDLAYQRGLPWYQANFPLSASAKIQQMFRGGEQPYLTGEASPYYLFHPLVPARVKAALPQVKLIALLRNPIDRAYSHYQHYIAAGFEQLSFEEAIEREPERLRGEEEKLLQDGNYCSYNHQMYSYLARGRYTEQLQRWWRHFPREQILLITSEEFSENPSAVSRRALEFLGTCEPDRESAMNEKYHAKPYTAPMNPETRRSLQEYFAPYNQELYELTGIQFKQD